MKAQGKSKDWLVLSTYLDGELTAREKEKLEQRLRADPSLRVQLSELKTTRSMIRSLPRKKVPRNFVLSPDMVKQRKPSGWFSLMGLTSIASAIVVLVLLFFQFVPGFILNAQPLMGKNAQEVSMFAESEMAADTTAQAGAPEIIYWGGPPNPNVAIGKGGGGEPIVVSPNQAAPLYEAQEAPSTAMEEPPQEPSAVEEAPTSEPSPEIISPAQEMPEATQESLAAPQLAPEENATEGTTDQTFEPILGIRPTGEAAQPLDSTQNVPLRQERSNFTIPPAAIIFLAGLSLATGLAAFILWRRPR